MYTINSLRISRYVRPIPGRDPLLFDSLKRPPPVSGHQILAFWMVAYGFDCVSDRTVVLNSQKRLTRTSFICHSHLSSEIVMGSMINW